MQRHCDSALVFFISVLLLTAVPRDAQANQPSAVATATNPRVQQHIEAAKQYLRKGDLLHARRAALKAWEAAKIKPRVPADGEPPWHSYLFPEGEALRFFVWERGTRISYVEIEEKGVSLSWQAHLSHTRDSSSTSKDDTSTFLGARRVLKEFGGRPKVTKALVFFELQPTIAALLYGRIMLREGRVVLGGVDTTYEENVVLPLPDEKMADPAR